MREMANNSMDFQVETDSLLGLSESGKLISSSPQVLSILSSVFERSIQKNEKLLKRLKKKDNVTIFHSSRAPTMGIGQYIDRILKYTCCGTACLIVAYIYIERYLQKMDVYLTSLNVHRLLITSIMVAAKFTDAGFKRKFLGERIKSNVDPVTKLELNVCLKLQGILAVPFKHSKENLSFLNFMVSLVFQSLELYEIFIL
ncbi:cyclin-P3-1 isoform X2 [Cucumis melo]|uniref:Cyclin-P3-1 isoform X2 n=1 Tax=Cucumis melo TaxID=3656 RepID=A0ABM3KSC3_CUCME|nr:cyclin-P3-1 isoform X2 [Cucumis melo]XP_050940682.1 cyclin-P3-1 isoform X2 [Cucumis melo]